MNMPSDALPTLEFTNADHLRLWLEKYHNDSSGIWIRIFKKNAAIPSVTFEEVLDEGLCFGWSESMRRKYDHNSYLQRFTPRRTMGTQSKRNLEKVRVLIDAGRMTPAGLKAIGVKTEKEKMSPERREKIENQAEVTDADGIELWQEFAAWEQASDEDWRKLEDSLGESHENLLAVLAKAPDVEPEEADRLPVPEGNG